MVQVCRRVISKYTGSSSACKNSTFWFAPDAGTDGLLLTGDDRTGTFLLDFGNSPGAESTCGSNTVNSRVRWCIGGAADSNSRVVVGTPDGWTPQGAYSPGSGTQPPQTAVAITTAGTVDDDLSQSWFAGSASPATTATDAASIDGAIARYTPTACFIVCFSSDRAIRVRDLTPKMTAPPIEKSGAPKGRIYLEVAYGVQNPSSVEAMEAVVATVSPESGRHDCGTYTLYGNSGSAAPFSNKNNAAYSGSGALPAAYKFTDAQAKQLADVCGTVDRINGLEIKLQVRGNTFNLPTAQWWLDGVKLSYDATRGANFPYPTNPGGTSSEDVKAKSDCDPEKPGGQLVFNGESHVVINDGTLEVCAGPYRPTATAADEPDKHQQIGIWSMPSVAEIGPTGQRDRRGCEHPGDRQRRQRHDDRQVERTDQVRHEQLGRRRRRTGTGPHGRLHRAQRLPHRQGDGAGRVQPEERRLYRSVRLSRRIAEAAGRRL